MLQGQKRWHSSCGGARRSQSVRTSRNRPAAHAPDIKSSAASPPTAGASSFPSCSGDVTSPCPAGLFSILSRFFCLRVKRSQQQDVGSDPRRTQPSRLCHRLRCLLTHNRGIIDVYSRLCLIWIKDVCADGRCKHRAECATAGSDHNNKNQRSCLIHQIRRSESQQISGLISTTAAKQQDRTLRWSHQNLDPLIQATPLGSATTNPAEPPKPGSLSCKVKELLRLNIY